MRVVPLDARGMLGEREGPVRAALEQAEGDGIPTGDDGGRSDVVDETLQARLCRVRPNGGGRIVRAQDGNDGGSRQTAEYCLGSRQGMMRARVGDRILEEFATVGIPLKYRYLVNVVPERRREGDTDVEGSARR